MSAENATADRCVGHCCKRFPLPFSPDEIQRRALEFLRWADTAARLGTARPDRADMDLVQIASMVIPLGSEPEADVARRHGYADGKTSSGVEGRVYFYTCRNLLPNGDCAIYALRPRMCSEYPYGRPCEHRDACASLAAREGRCGTPMGRWRATPSEVWERLEEHATMDARFEVAPTLIAQRPRSKEAAA